MKPTFNLRVPTNGFTFKPVVEKPKRVSTSHKPLSRTLYAVAHKENGVWQAYINTKGLKEYDKDTTILPFTERTFELKGRNNVFLHEKDKTNHWVRIIRSDSDAIFYPGNKESYCTLCEGCVFSGHIVKIDGILQFDMGVYCGTYSKCELLITESNSKNNDE